MRLRAGLARPGHGAELPARGDAELDEDLPQVPFNGVRADEQLRTDLLVRQAVACQPRDLRLLAGQFVTRADRLLARRLQAVPGEPVRRRLAHPFG